MVDDTGSVKKGVTSAGVGRQHTGTSGKIDNCRIGMFVAYESRRERALADPNSAAPVGRWPTAA
ncbi:transposase [Embleya sp. NBC_00896]|uniref:transposase n=1 Tax=Embleya sp. NBC_00896 TaxID=2975961 RepID=UPI00387024C6